jgi:hypothetical protein
MDRQPVLFGEGYRIRYSSPNRTSEWAGRQGDT